MAGADSKVQRKERKSKRAERAESYILGVPARLMRPRLVFAVAAFALLLFGLLMIYSASSVTALCSEDYNYDAMYFLKHQLVGVAIGLVALGVIIFFDYHVWCGRILLAIWGVSMVLLVLVKIAGVGAYGATRWIQVGPVTVQPSELAKPVLVLTLASILQRHHEENAGISGRTILMLVVGVAIPIAMVFLQPDKGTTVIIVGTLLCMALLAGLPTPVFFGIIIFGAVGLIIISIAQDYSLARISAMFNPFADFYDTGWQLGNGFYAFGSGGLFGLGIGMSRQKYAYLPMAHNDMIFAVIGEETGFVGTVLVLLVFAALVWAGLEVSRHAPDLEGRLVAAGCTFTLGIQAFVNVLGVLGILPLTGKPLPFISYGNTAIISTLICTGLVLCVSRSSSLPETVHDVRRRSMVTVGGADAPDDETFVGEPTRRSARGSAQQSTRQSDAGGRRTLTLHEGGAAGERPSSGDDRAQRSGRRERIDLGPSAADRLRPNRRRPGRDE